MPVNPTYSVGTVAVSAGSAIVTGTGTMFIAGEVRAGDIFERGGLSVSILNVDSNTQVTLVKPWPGAAGSGSYEIRYTPDAARVLANARNAIDLFESFTPDLEVTKFPPYVPYATQAAFLQANIPAEIMTTSAVVGGVLKTFRRDPGGRIGPTADGGMWAPLGVDLTPDSGLTSTPMISIAPGTTTRPRNHLFVRQDTSVRNDNVAVQIQRAVKTSDGLSNPKALRVISTVEVNTSQTEWAISGELDNYSNTASTGNAALSGVSNKFGTAAVFAGHLQAKDWNVFATATAVTALIGAEINTPCIGLDHPTENNGLGVRRTWDVIARTNRQVGNWNTAAGNSGEGETGAGIVIRTDNATGGYFRFGLVIDDVSQLGNPNSIGVGLMTRTSGTDGISVRGGNTGAAIRIVPVTPGLFGLKIQGSFTTGAIGIDSGQWLTMSNDNTRRVRYSSGTDSFEFYNGIDNRASFRVNASPALSLGGTQVVGTRRTGWGADTGTAKRTANTTYAATAEPAYTQATVQALMNSVRDLSQTVKALKDDLIAHGIIGA